MTLLKAMRSRNNTVTNQSGPPYERLIGRSGIPTFNYKKTHIDAWMKKRNLLLTAKEAADVLGIGRDDILKIHGSKRFDFKQFSLVCNPDKNMFIMILAKKRR